MQYITTMAPAAKSLADSLCEVIQDLLVPELNGVKESVDSLRNEMKLSHENFCEEMRLRNDSLERVILHSNERLASLEARLPRQ